MLLCEVVNDSTRLCWCVEQHFFAFTWIRPSCGRVYGSIVVLGLNV